MRLKHLFCNKLSSLLSLSTAITTLLVMMRTVFRFCFSSAIVRIVFSCVASCLSIVLSNIYVSFLSFVSLFFLLQLSLVTTIHGDIQWDTCRNFVWSPINQKNWKIELRNFINNSGECHRQPPS